MGNKKHSCSSKAAKSLWFDVRVNEICVNFALPEVYFQFRTGKTSFLEFYQRNTLFGKANYSMFHYSLRVIDEPKMSEIRILNLYLQIFIDIYRQSLLTTATFYHFDTYVKVNVQWIIKSVSP